MRHPAAFAASIKRLKWGHPFEHLLEQEMLMKRHLEPYRAEIASKPEDIVDQAAIVWNCIYGVLFSYLASNANWLVRKHEVLSGNPVAELRSFIRDPRIVKWTTKAEDEVAKYTRSSNVAAPDGTIHHITRDSAAVISRWKEILTKDEIARVYEITRPVCGSFYPDEDWDS